MEAQRPDQIWVCDITYVATAEGWLYLAVILDLFSRRVVGWEVGESLEAELAQAARWKTRCDCVSLDQDRFFISDRGSQ